MRYRMLEAGEVIGKDDEFLYGDKWDIAPAYGHLIDRGSVGLYRRPIPDADDAKKASEDRVATIEAMAARGGNFVKALAVAAAAADKNNYHRLKQAFPDIWDNYAPK